MTATPVTTTDGDLYGQRGEDNASVEEATIEDETQFRSKAKHGLSRRTETMTRTPSCPSRLFEAKASVVLVGLPGTGKSSLAIMASTACNLRLIEIDRYFKKVTGHSMRSHRRALGIVAHYKAQSEVLKTVLSTCQRGCLIVCSPASMDREGQTILRNFAKTHPIIHVVRDIKSLQRCLSGWSRAKVEQLMDLGGSLLRACSNFEFYNLTEDIRVEEVEDAAGRLGQRRLATGQKSPRTPFLTLKRVEREFLKFLGHITGGNLTISFRESTYPLSRVPVESRSFTYAVQVHLDYLTSGRYDAEDLEIASDVFEILIDGTVSSEMNGPPSNSRLDEFGRALTTVRRDTVVPLLYHVQFSEVNADVNNSSIYEHYCDLLHHCLRLGPEFVTVDLLLDDETISRLNALKGHTKLIGHFTFIKRPAGGWDNSYCIALFERVCKLKLDACRINMPADTIHDNFALQSFKRRAEIVRPELTLIAYNTGSIGRMSVCFNSTFTPVHPECVDLPVSLSPTMLTARECTRCLYASFVFEPMNFYIIGAAIAYTLSPVMHNAAYKRCGMPHSFTIWQTESLDILQEMLNDKRFGGTAVNPPFKTEVIALTQSLSPHAKAIGAINTLIPVRQSRSSGEYPGELLALLQERNHTGPVKYLHGDNTDWIGVRTCIRRGLSPINAVGANSTGLVIGAGGMARATIYAMIHLGVRHIFIYNRSVANAEKLATHYNTLRPEDTASNGKPTALVTKNPQAPQSSVRVIESLQTAWPLNFQQPTIIVSCIPAHDIGGNPAANFTLPMQWFQSPTGGVVVEVSWPKALECSN